MKAVTPVEAVINSMIRKERLNSSIINGSRRKRTANGPGTTVMEVNNLKRARMSKMFKTIAAEEVWARLQHLMKPNGRNAKFRTIM